jgi:hypothetical protein
MKALIEMKGRLKAIKRERAKSSKENVRYQVNVPGEHVVGVHRRFPFLLRGDA